MFHSEPQLFRYKQRVSDVDGIDNFRTGGAFEGESQQLGRGSPLGGVFGGVDMSRKDGGAAGFAAGHTDGWFGNSSSSNDNVLPRGCGAGAGGATPWPTLSPLQFNDWFYNFYFSELFYM